VSRMGQPKPIEPGELAPLFSLPATDNTIWSLAQLLRGRRALLLFFRRDCPASRLMLQLLERIYRRLYRAGLRAAGIAQDSHRDTLEMADAYQITFPLLIDHPRFEVSRAYGITKVPARLLLDPERRVVARGDGFSRSELEALFAQLTRELDGTAESLFHPGDMYPENLPGWPAANVEPPKPDPPAAG
jgi:peroxiredoxin